ncbi:hypothetical protein Lesp02_46820 [Lentzea sp. NBRC 105346]|uniref:hypothetical protein n=1 Tax=Lentzea sp. NBRC 105346 TaxID=3032205 RepID=UPI00249FC4D6|nr:hypothetical protein [Lentzea sp. NBRC 105346]GLZ32494.1 hypothetical protein Lesp02_46820 [Lentzea sp. NBRC 105346]
MRKSLIGALAPLAAMAGLVGAGTAQADTPDQAPTLQELNEQWNEGGAAIGGGAAQMVSAAWLGIPDSVLVYGGGPTGLHDVEYVNGEG